MGNIITEMIEGNEISKAEIIELAAAPAGLFEIDQSYSNVSENFEAFTLRTLNPDDPDLPHALGLDFFALVDVGKMTAVWLPVKIT